MAAENAVCLCVDRNMLVPAVFAATSIHDASPSRDFDILLFAGPDDVDPKERAWIEARGIEVRHDLRSGKFADIDAAKGRLTRVTMARLLLPEHLADRYEKLLYLDADVMVVADPGSIFALDTGPFVLGAVPSARIWAGWAARRQAIDEAHFRALGMTAPFRFFNSGVLLIDVAKWNRDDTGARALNFIRQHPDLCFLPDEHGLNAVLDGRLAELSPIWNMRAGPWAAREVRAVAEPVGLHFDGPLKPWKRFIGGGRLFRHRAAYRAYDAFLDQSPWAGWLREQWNGADLRANLAFEMKHWTGWTAGGTSPLEERRLRREHGVAYRDFCLTHPFADIEQGIVSRAGGRVRLAGKPGEVT